MTEINHGPEETEPLLGALLRMPYQAMMNERVEPDLEAAGYGDVRSSHLPVVQALTWHSAGLRATDLASHARITKQSMGYLVDTLEARGYIERVPDPDDGRAKVVQLTERGWAMTRTIRDSVRAMEAEWAARIGPARLDQLRTTLRDLVIDAAPPR